VKWPPPTWPNLWNNENFIVNYNILLNLNKRYIESTNKGNNKITKLRTILQRESQNSQVYKNVSYHKIYYHIF